MIVINDNPDVDCVYDHPNIRIINHKERFSSVGAKLQWGFKQCKYDYIYRLDEIWALQNVQTDIESNPGFEIYRSKGMHFFVNNINEGEGGSVNNGNVYTKAHIDRIEVPNTSLGEDSDMTIGNSSKIYTSKLKHTMIYRWGMGTLHISGMGNVSNEAVLAQVDKMLDDVKGEILKMIIMNK